MKGYGQSIETELKHKIVKGLFADNDSYINKKPFEGLEYIDFNVKKDFVLSIFSELMPIHLITTIFR